MIFKDRHIGPSHAEQIDLLKNIGIDSLDTLIDETIPSKIRYTKPLSLDTALSESDYLDQLKEKTQKNKVFKSYIGQGYHECNTPTVILRNILENPGWYTQYTPYQAEISQGRLESLLNFQTLVTELTGLPTANASLLDEATAAAEAMAMFYRNKDKSKKNAHTFIVSDTCFKHTLDVLKTRADAIGIIIEVQDAKELDFHADVFGCLLQYPDANGDISQCQANIKHAQDTAVLVAVACDLLSLTLLTPPGELGADVVCGTTQRFGVPMGFGGPHAAYFATKDSFNRQIPGRIIGVSIDKHGKRALRMALQTREQHIRKDKATSNICTAQALLANIASMYAVYHGPSGLKAIATSIHTFTKQIANTVPNDSLTLINDSFFDTLTFTASAEKVAELKAKTQAATINLRYDSDTQFGLSVDESKSTQDIARLLSIFKEVFGKGTQKEATGISNAEKRQSSFLEQAIFNTQHSETMMLRYMKSLENKDLSLNTAMIPLGSCTMKLNATTEMIPITWPEVSNIHPFAPQEQTLGYLEIIKDFEKDLATITGFDAVSLQPNSGAQGEFAGLITIQHYFKAKGESHRNIALIPTSAHGTNPASAVMAGLKVVAIKCLEDGTIDMPDLIEKCTLHSKNLSCLMITYPSTYGVFDEDIVDICALIHTHGGQVYMDGANMNAQVGLTSPGFIGADVCHLNLHKTFAIPHGGGGPGVGPIGVAKHLTEFLPGHAVVNINKTASAVSAAPYGSGSILLISYGYIKLLGVRGVTESTKIAILNANYIKSRLSAYYPVLYTVKNGHVAHELIIDIRPFKKEAKIDVEDVAKRLIDYGYHAPTMSWPVPGTLMIEPTESEDKAELDRFCDAMIGIYNEVQAIKAKTLDIDDNPLKNAPHTAAEALSDNWSHSYSRESAVYPLPYVKENKFWPSVGRLNQAHGDRNLICTCGNVEDYTD
jgi:glycine dehydrogenase